MLQELGTTRFTPALPTQPRASLIIVSYNAWNQLEACLRSLRDDLHPDYEVIVVDNASSDGSAEKVSQHFPEFTLIPNASNLGFGGGNNTGALYAQGQYLAFLNPDTVVEPGWLENLIATLEDDPSAGLATSKVLLMGDPQQINACGNDLHISGLTLCRGLGMPGSAFTQVEEVGAVSGASFAIRRELFEMLGGFDAGFFLYMEDTDLSLRARLAGYRCLLAPASRVYHDYRLAFGPRKTYYQERNRYRMLLKVLQWRTLLALLPALILAEFVTWGFVLLHEPGRAANKLDAYAWVVKHWQETSQLRRKTQTLRKVSDGELLAICTHKLGYEQAGLRWASWAAHIIFDPLFVALYRILDSLLDAQTHRR